MTTYGSSKTATTRVLSGLFRDGEKAEQAYQSLLDLGYDRGEITVVMSDETRTRYGTPGVPTTVEHGTKAAEGAGIGGGIGAAAGALFGALAAIGTSLIVPGLGVLIAGPLAAGLAGAGAGSIAGGLLGALVGSGIPEERAREYERGIREGSILISLLPDNETAAAQLERLFQDAGGELILR